MCSSRAIVDDLECCMEDLVECFEDYVRKSLILIFAGIGVIVGLLCYLLKMVSERRPINSAVVAENRYLKQNEVNAVIEKNKIVEEEEEVKQDTISKISNKLKDIENNETAKNPPISPSFDEIVLREVGFSSCSKSVCDAGSSTHILSRVPVPSLTSSSSKHKMIPCIRKRSLNKSSIPSLQICPKVNKPGSCSSMCCYEDPNRNGD